MGVEHFCRAAGLEVAYLQALLDEGLVEGVYDGSGRLIGVWDDRLPSVERLRQAGVPVASTYSPGLLRSAARSPVDDQNDDDDGDEGATWTMSW